MTHNSEPSLLSFITFRNLELSSHNLKVFFVLVSGLWLTQSDLMGSKRTQGQTQGLMCTGSTCNYLSCVFWGMKILSCPRFLVPHYPVSQCTDLSVVTPPPALDVRISSDVQNNGRMNGCWGMIRLRHCICGIFRPILEIPHETESKA